MDGERHSTPGVLQQPWAGDRASKNQPDHDGPEPDHSPVTLFPWRWIPKKRFPGTLTGESFDLISLP
jgi:hypothetical protein